MTNPSDSPKGATALFQAIGGLIDQWSGGAPLVVPAIPLDVSAIGDLLEAMPDDIQELGISETLLTAEQVARLHTQALTGDLGAIHRLALHSAMTQVREAGQCIVESFHDQRRQHKARLVTSKGGQRSGETKRRQRIQRDAWMNPILDEAYRRLEADCPAVIGRDKLLLAAHRVAGPGHPDHHRRDEIKERQVRAYLDSKRHTRA